MAHRWNTANGAMVLPFKTLRAAIGVLAILLPIVLLSAGGPRLDTISDYFYSDLGTYFTGTFCAISVFLFAYHGRAEQPASAARCWAEQRHSPLSAHLRFGACFSMPRHSSYILVEVPMNEKSLFCPNLFAFVLTAALAGCGSMPPGSESSIVNFHAIDKRGLIYRSGQPDTDADWATLKQLGIKTVIKLNQYVGSHDTLESEQGLADRYGVEVVRHLMQPEDWPVNWNLGAEPDVKEVKATAALLADAREPVLLHCSHGKDRTGLVIAVYRVEQQNWCKSTAYAEMLTYGHNPSLTGIRKVLDSAQIVESQTCK